jgi:DNA helicase-4
MNKQRGPSNLVKIILFIISLGIWFLYDRWRKAQKNKQELIELLPQIEKATAEFTPYFSGEKYFAHYDYLQIRSRHTSLLSRISQFYYPSSTTVQKTERKQ